MSLAPSDFTPAELPAANRTNSIRSTARDRSAWSAAAVREAVLDRIVTSNEPAAVLASLARGVVPELAVACSVSIVDDDQVTSEVTYPERPVRRGAEPAGASGSGSAGRAAGILVTVRTRVDPLANQPGLSVVARFELDARRATEEPPMLVEVTASLLLERAAQMIQRGRLAAALEAERNKTQNLTVALESNREIGQAIGILMARRRITSEQAFDRLRAVSQRTHRKLRELAEDVVETGILEGGAVPRSLRIAK